MQNSLIKELKSLYTGEGFSSVMFFLIWMYCCFNHEYQEMALKAQAKATLLYSTESNTEQTYNIYKQLI